MSWLFYRLYVSGSEKLDSHDDVRNPTNFPGYLYSCVRESSFQGFSQIVKQPGIIKKLLWLAAVALCSYGLYWELSIFFMKFSQSKVLARVSVNIEDTVYFPAVTVCNSNRMVKSWYSQHVKQTSPNVTIQVVQDTALADAGDLEQTGHFLCDMIMFCSFDSLPCKPINKEFDTFHWSYSGGNCYTFNAGYNLSNTPVAKTSRAWLVKTGGPAGTAVRRSRAAGVRHGLRLVLSSDIERYLDTTEEVGWQIVVHNQTVMPFPTENGVSVEPGSSTKISVSQKYQKRLGIRDNFLYKSTYSNCIELDRLSDPDDGSKLEVVYSKSLCLRQCYQQYVIKTCQCYNPDITFARNEKVQPCDQISSGDPNSCLHQVLADVSLGAIACNCPEACTSHDYETTVSSLKWPNSNKNALRQVCKRLLDIIKQRANRSDATCTTASRLAEDFLSPKVGKLPQVHDMERCLNEIDNTANQDTFSELVAIETVRRKYAEVYVYFKDFFLESAIEEERYSLPDLIISVGAILSFFFGITVITGFEFIQFFLDIALVLLFRCLNSLTALGKRVTGVGASSEITVSGPVNINQIETQVQMNRLSTPVSAVLAPELPPQVPPRNISNSRFDIDEDGWQ